MIYLRALHAQAEAAPLLGAEPLVARLQFGWGAAFRQEYIGGTARAIGRPGLLLPLELVLPEPLGWQIWKSLCCTTPR